MDLGSILIEFRKENHLSQREFAKRCGLSNALISIIEMGKNRQTGKKSTPDLETYKKLAAGMGISVQSLFEKLDDSELVNLSTHTHPIVVPDTDLFRKIIEHMSVSDYEMVMDAFNRTYNKMKEMGIIE